LPKHLGDFYNLLLNGDVHWAQAVLAFHSVDFVHDVDAYRLDYLGDTVVCLFVC